MISHLLWAANRESAGTGVSNFRVGYMSSYVNVKSTDMFEIYKFNFMIGYPF